MHTIYFHRLVHSCTQAIQITLAWSALSCGVLSQWYGTTVAQQRTVPIRFRAVFRSWGSYVCAFLEPILLKAVVCSGYKKPGARTHAVHIHPRHILRAAVRLANVCGVPYPLFVVTASFFVSCISSFSSPTSLRMCLLCTQTQFDYAGTGATHVVQGHASLAEGGPRLAAGRHGG